MMPKLFIALGYSLIVGVLAGWVALARDAAWPLTVVVVSSAPLALTLLSMMTLKAKPFFYAAMTLTLYIAFAITQIIVAPESRLWAVVVLAVALVYLAALKFVLQALNARRQPDQVSS